jgi:hypothetical protein
MRYDHGQGWFGRDNDLVPYSNYVCTQLEIYIDLPLTKAGTLNFPIAPVK